MEPLTLGLLRKIWQAIVQDPDARKALDRLERFGFAIKHLKPQDPTLKHPSWADDIAALPFLSDRPAHRRIYRAIGLKKHTLLITALRRFAEKVADPFCEVEIASPKDYSLREITSIGQRAMETADFLEHFLLWEWYARHVNQRNHKIAELRWEIRRRTHNPHDHELGVIVDAAFRAAGKEEIYLDATTLDRIEKREKEGRVKATRGLHYRKGARSASKRSSRSSSTTFPRKTKKRV